MVIDEKYWGKLNIFPFTYILILVLYLLIQLGLEKGKQHQIVIRCMVHKMATLAQALLKCSTWQLNSLVPSTQISIVMTFLLVNGFALMEVLNYLNKLYSKNGNKINVLNKQKYMHACMFFCCFNSFYENG